MLVEKITVRGGYCKKGRTGHFIENDSGIRSTDQRHESGRPKHACTEENVTAVDELVSLLSQEGQTHTSFNSQHAKYPKRRV